MLLQRRAVLKGGLAGLAALMGCGSNKEAVTPEVPEAGTIIAGGDEFPWSPLPRPKIVSNVAALGDLGSADANGVRLPPGFSSRIVARTGQPPIAGKDYRWHDLPDGGATFPTADGGWIYVSNSEVPLFGGVSALKLDANGALVDAYRILEKTNVNCAGGATPWDTWLSCEEIDRGRVFECDPRGVVEAIARPALGIFKHEAAAVDPLLHHVYLTEDERDGNFYRFVPNGKNKHGFANLAEGTLEVAVVGQDGAVTWRAVPDPLYEQAIPTRKQVAEATRFNGGEGIAWHAGVVYFTTKGDDRVWAYDTNASKMSVLYDAKTAATPILSGVDNVTITAGGDVLVAEDAGNMQIVAILPNGQPKALVEVVGYADSELCGPAFDPSGTRLYFSSQRGPRGGATFEITGPFHLPA